MQTINNGGCKGRKFTGIGPMIPVQNRDPLEDV